MPQPKLSKSELTARGSRWAKDRPDDAEPVSADFRCPPWVAGFAADEWDRIVPILESLGIIGGQDIPLLAVWCSCVGAARTLTEIIDREGSIVTRPDGQQASHPACKLRSDAWSTMLALSAKFGFTPRDRNGLAGRRQPAGKLDRYRNGPRLVRPDEGA